MTHFYYLLTQFNSISFPIFLHLLLIYILLAIGCMSVCVLVRHSLSYLLINYLLKTDYFTSLVLGSLHWEQGLSYSYLILFLLQLDSGTLQISQMIGNLLVSFVSLAQMVKRLSTMQETWVRSPGMGRSPGEGNGNPLQYYCLENPMDRGAW